MFTNKKSLLALSIASAFALTGCFSDDDSNNFVPPEPVPEEVVPPEAPVSLSPVVYGNVVDVDDATVLPSTISFFENGVLSENIVDVDGNVTATVDSEDGSFVFQLADGADIDSITAVVTAEDYLSKAFVIDLSDVESGDVSVELGLTSEATEGVAISTPVEATIGEDGTSTTPIEVPVDNDDGAKSKVTVPAGTVLQDANGDPVTGTIFVTVVTAKPGSNAAAAIVPQGLNSADSTTVLTPAGVTSVEMVTADGVKVKRFSSPIDVEMAVKAGSPATLDLSSQNEDTGLWSAEDNDVTVAADVGSFTTDHLTFFAATTSSPVCSTPIRFLFDGAPFPASFLNVRISSSDFDNTFPVMGNFTIPSFWVSLFGISDTATARVRVRDLEGTLWYDSAVEAPVCGDVDVTLLAPEVTYVNETLSLTAVCSNDQSKTVGASGALVKYNRAGKGKRKAKGNGDGTYNIDDMIQGETYTVEVKYKGALSEIGTQTYSITASADDAITSQSESIECETRPATGGTGGTGGN